MRPTILFDIDDTIINTTEAVIQTYRPNLTYSQVKALALRNKEWNFTSILPEYNPSVFDDPIFQGHLKIDPTFKIMEATIFKHFNVVLGTGGSDEYNAFKATMFPNYLIRFFPCVPYPRKDDYPCDIQIDDRSSCLSSKATLKILIKNNKDTSYNQDPPEGTYIVNVLQEAEEILSFYLKHPKMFN